MNRTTAHPRARRWIACLGLVLASAASGTALAAPPLAGTTTVDLPADIYDLNGTLNFSVSAENRSGTLSFDMSAVVVHDERGRLTSSNATVSNVIAPDLGALAGTLSCTGKGSLRGVRRPGTDWTRIRGVFRCSGTLDGAPSTATITLDNRYDALANQTRENNRVVGRIGNQRGSFRDRETFFGAPAFLPAADDPVLTLQGVAVDSRGNFTGDGELQIDGLGGSETYDAPVRGRYREATSTSRLTARGPGGSRVSLRDLSVSGGSGDGGSFVLRMLGFTVKGDVP